MKKFTLIAAFFTAIGFTNNQAQAQNFTLDKDTSKTNWYGTGYLVDVKVYGTNKTSSPLTMHWNIINFKKDAGWKFENVCDNKDCLVEAEPGLVDGSKTFSTNPVDPGLNCEFKLTWDGDGAAMYTTATATLQIQGGTTVDTATFVATKKPAGITTAILKNDDIAIFPNPASNYVDVVYNPSADVKTIAFYNLIGKVVGVYKVTDRNSARCEFTNDMPSGIYIMRIADSRGNVIATRKITRQ